MDFLNKKSESLNSIFPEDNGALSFDSKKYSEIFNSYFSNLAVNLLKKLPSFKGKFNVNRVSQYYQDRIKDKSLVFEDIEERKTLTLLERTETSKAASINNLSGVFLRILF